MEEQQKWIYAILSVKGWKQSYFTHLRPGQLHRRRWHVASFYQQSLRMIVNRLAGQSSRYRNVKENCRRACSVGAMKRKKTELAWSHIEKKWWQHCQTSTTVDGDPGIPKKRSGKKEIWTAGCRHSWRKMEAHNTELDGDKRCSQDVKWQDRDETETFKTETTSLWSVIYVPMGASRRMSCQVFKLRKRQILAPDGFDTGKPQ